MRKIILSAFLLVVAAVVATVTTNRRRQPVATVEPILVQEQPPSNTSAAQIREEKTHSHGCASYPPTLADDLVLFLRRDGYVQALEGSTGSRKWISGRQ